jgi:hypothetical protein
MIELAGVTTFIALWFVAAGGMAYVTFFDD